MDTNNLPDRVRDELTGPEVEAITAYVDPSSDTFGNKKASAEAAGVSDAYHLFRKPRVQAAVEWLEERRLDQAREMADFAKRMATHAMHELARDMFLGQELRVINPEDILGGSIRSGSLEDEEANLMREINRHNTQVAKLKKQARAARRDLIEYGIGTPEQRMRHVHEQEGDSLDLSELSQEELMKLGEVVEEMLGQKESPDSAHEDAIEAEYEVVTED